MLTYSVRCIVQALSARNNHPLRNTTVAPRRRQSTDKHRLSGIPPSAEADARDLPPLNACVVDSRGNHRNRSGLLNNTKKRHAVRDVQSLWVMQESNLRPLPCEGSALAAAPITRLVKKAGFLRTRGRYKIRTCDPFRVREVRYHCANRPVDSNDRSHSYEVGTRVELVYTALQAAA